MRLILGMGFFAIAVAFALLRGGAPERRFALVMIAMLFVDRAVHPFLEPGDSVSIGRLHFGIDLTGFIAMLLVMIRARRFWPIWACSFQLLSLASYATPAMSPQLSPAVPAILAIAPSYLICASLIVGTALHRARSKRLGNDPPWRVS